jgi:hypothetical protein
MISPDEGKKINVKLFNTLTIVNNRLFSSSRTLFSFLGHAAEQTRG